MNFKQKLSWILFLFVLWLSSPLFAGSAGVKNGFVRGMVRTLNSNPLAGVNVVLVRESSTPLIRQTLSNEDGIYEFPQVPVGLYTLGFEKYGFEPITTERGSQEDRSAIGKQIRVYVESGALVTATPVTLRELSAHGRALLHFKLIDQFTGDPVPAATLTLGNQSSVPTGNPGEHKVELFIPPSSDGPPETALFIQAPGFEPVKESIKPIPNTPTKLTLEVTPLLGVIQGKLDFSGFVGVDLSARTKITVASIPAHITDSKIDPSGHFEVFVPVSTPENPRTFTLMIHAQGFLAQRIPNIQAPLSGATTITLPIRLQAKTTRVQGKVLTSTGRIGLPSGLNQAFIKEIGISAPIHGGSYFFEAVPTGMELSIEVFLKNEEGKTERGELGFSATINSQSSFHLPTILTNP